MQSNKTKINSKTLKVFETFSGIGAQHKALQFLKDNYDYDYKVVGKSEWDVDAQIFYATDDIAWIKIFKSKSP